MCGFIYVDAKLENIYGRINAAKIILVLLYLK